MLDLLGGAEAEEEVGHSKTGRVAHAFLFGAMLAEIHLLHLSLDDLCEVNRGIVFLADVAAHVLVQQIGVPVVRVNSRKSPVNLRVTGPGLPSWMRRESSSTAGMISAAVPVRKHSSAV